MATLSRRSKKVRKPRSRKNDHFVSAIKSLPHDLLLQVIPKVASNSFEDLCRVRRSCKEFNKAAQQDYVFEHVSIEKFPLIPIRTRKEFRKFMKRCEECGNAEALYRQGFIKLFGLKLFCESGFGCLEKAAGKGHIGATYVYGGGGGGRGDGGGLACVGGEAMKQQGLILV